jgi:riboflavin transport system permease protein
MKKTIKKKGFFLLVMMVLAYLFSALLISLFFEPVFEGWKDFFLSPFSHPLYRGNWLNRATIYILSSSAVVMAFQGGEFNLGGEGQICLGGIVTVIVLSLWEPARGWVGIISVMILASFASALLAGLSGILKNRTGMSEVITTYLLSMGVIILSRYFITGPFKDDQSYLITTPEIPERFQLGEILPPSHLNISLFTALILIGFIYLFLYYRPSGYEWRLCGVNRNFAAYCGIDRNRQTLKTLSISGALNGYTGAVIILGTTHRGIQGFFSGFGWDGIAVSLIGGNHPLLILPSALFFSHIVQGAEKLNQAGQFPYPLDSFVMALIFLVVTSGRLNRD